MSRRTTRALAAIAFAALLVILWNRRKALRHAKPLTPVAAASSSARALRGKPRSAKELATTDANIYLGNLDGQIEELTRLTRQQPDSVSNVLFLSAVHHTRGRFRGDLDEIQAGIDLTGTCAKLTPENANCPLVRAEQEQSLHRFKEARIDLARAKDLGGDPARIAGLEVELDWNDGLYDAAIPAIRKARLMKPTTSSWIREGQLDHDLGLEAVADAAFETAEDLIVDTGPLVLAHLDVQRGIQKTQTGRLEEAVAFFREAAARIPTYVAANEHLAEALHALGKDEEATKLYEEVVKISDDPEFKHALAELYALSGKTEEAKALEAKARAGYDVLLRKYPEAMYWHASEFYMAIGDKKRALDLLQKNLVLRPNSTSLVALARAELANGQNDEARRSIDKALAMPLVSASLFWTASRIYENAGDTSSAARFRERAEKLNPRIVTDER